MSSPRESLLAQTFVQLADSLLDDFDIVDLLTVLTTRTVELVDAAEAGILLDGQEGGLRVMAASSDVAQVLELFQLQHSEGPCFDCYRSGRPVVNVDLMVSDRWPGFGPRALAAGFRSVHAIPMRLRRMVIGALNVFLEDRVLLADDDLAIGQALADTATIAVLQNRAVVHSHALVGQLQRALDTRVILEQAKGILAERAHIHTDEAFDGIRRYAASHGRQLRAVAEEVITGTLRLDLLQDGSGTRSADLEPTGGPPR